MTNQEAIKIIEVARAEVEWEYPMNYAAAFDKAIEALSKIDRQNEKIYELEIKIDELNEELQDWSERD